MHNLEVLFGSNELVVVVGGLALRLYDFAPLLLGHLLKLVFLGENQLELGRLLVHLSLQPGDGGSRGSPFALRFERLGSHFSNLVLELGLLLRQPLHLVSEVGLVFPRLGQVGFELRDALPVHAHLLAHAALIATHLVDGAGVDLNVPEQVLAPALVHVEFVLEPVRVDASTVHLLLHLLDLLVSLGHLSLQVLHVLRKGSIVALEGTLVAFFALQLSDQSLVLLFHDAQPVLGRS